MPTYGKYTLTPDQVNFIQDEMASVCEGVDFELGFDCSGSMSNPAEPGKLRTRFEVGRDIFLALAEPVMAMDDKIGVWAIKDQIRSPFRSPNYFKDNLGSVDDVRKYLNGLICGGGTPLREVLELALERYINRLKEDSNTKSFNLVIVGDGYDGDVADIIQNAAGRVWEITR